MTSRHPAVAWHDPYNGDTERLAKDAAAYQAKFMVTIRFIVDGSEEHAAKLAGKAEDAIATSKLSRRIVDQEDGALIATDIARLSVARTEKEGIGDP